MSVGCSEHLYLSIGIGGLAHLVTEQTLLKGDHVLGTDMLVANMPGTGLVPEDLTV